MPFFRVYHILFGAAALAAYLTAEELGLVHAWLGYGIAALLLLRLALGLVHSRGFEFRRLLPRGGRAPLGQGGIRHPAIGHALTLALLVSIGGAATTGIAMDRGGTLVGQSIRNGDGEGREHDEREDDEDHELSLGLIGTARAGDDGDGAEGGEDEGGPLGELHETFGNIMLPLVLAHLGWLLLFRLDLARYVLFLKRARVSR
jgi:cytochrome b